MERALGAAEILNPSQRANARHKADDLLRERTVWKSVPFRLMLEANRRCNVQCVHCDIDRTGTGDLDLALIDALMESVGWGSMEIMPFLGGEPTLAPIQDLARLARKHNNYLNFITNGILFDRAYYSSIADVTARVHFSLHSHRSKEAQQVMPGCSLPDLCRNIADATAIAEQTGAQILCGLVVMDSNLEDLSDYIRFVYDLGVRRVIFQKLYPWTKAGPQAGVSLRRSSAEIRHHVRQALETAIELGVFLETNVDEAFGDPRNKNPHNSPFDVLQDNVHVVELFNPKFCISTATTILVEWDGTVLPCCRDHIELGNLYESSFLDLWNGKAMQELRQTFFRRQLRPFCKKCMAFYNNHA